MEAALSLQVFNLMIWLANAFAIVALGIVGWVVKNLVSDMDKLTDKVHKVELSLALGQPPTWLIDRIQRLERDVQSIQNSGG